MRYAWVMMAVCLAGMASGQVSPEEAKARLAAKAASQPSQAEELDRLRREVIRLKAENEKLTKDLSAKDKPTKATTAKAGSGDFTKAIEAEVAKQVEDVQSEIDQIDKKLNNPKIKPGDKESLRWERGALVDRIANIKLAPPPTEIPFSRESLVVDGVGTMTGRFFKVINIYDTKSAVCEIGLCDRRHFRDQGKAQVFLREFDFSKEADERIVQTTRGFKVVGTQKVDIYGTLFVLEPAN